MKTPKLNVTFSERVEQYETNQSSEGRDQGRNDFVEFLPPCILGPSWIYGVLSHLPVEAQKRIVAKVIGKKVSLKHIQGDSGIEY
jgi:hypothetical protein